MAMFAAGGNDGNEVVFDAEAKDLFDSFRVFCNRKNVSFIIFCFPIRTIGANIVGMTSSVVMLYIICQFTLNKNKIVSFSSFNNKMKEKKELNKNKIFNTENIFICLHN